MKPSIVYVNNYFNFSLWIFYLWNSM